MQPNLFQFLSAFLIRTGKHITMNKMNIQIRSNSRSYVDTMMGIIT